MPGPPPNPNARRRNARPDWVVLPADGRQGDPPEFPLGRPSMSVLKLWAVLWASPQAVAWEGMGEATIRTVARYAKLVLEAEKSKAQTSLLAEVRQLEDRLGLTPMSMKRLQWQIDDRPVSTGGDEGDGATVTSMDEWIKLYGAPGS